MHSTEIRSLHMSLEPFVEKSIHEIPITIKLHECYGDQYISVVRVLLETMFGIENTQAMKLFRVVPGSFRIVLLTPSHIYTSLFKHVHKLTVETKLFCKLVCIVSVQVNTKYVFCVTNKHSNQQYTFEIALLEAVKISNREAVKFLLEHVHTDINTQTQLNSEVELVQQYVAKAKKNISIQETFPGDPESEIADVFFPDFNDNIYFEHDIGTTPLMIACSNYDTDMVELLLKHNANTNLQTSTGWTALMYAARLGNTRTVEVLLKHNAEVDMALSNNNANALILCHPGNVRTMKVLLDNGADPNFRFNNGATLLGIACYFGAVKAVEVLLKYEANPNQQQPISDHCESSVAYIASSEGNLEVLDLLIQAKADLDACNTYGEAPIHVASHKGNYQIVKRLLQANANPHIRTNDGSTALFIVCQLGYLNLVELLLQAKVNPDLPRQSGATSIFIACCKGHLKVVDMLLKANANPNVQANNGATPLHVASENNSHKMVKRLLKGGANPNIQGERGVTPLIIAAQVGHFKIVEELLKSNANPNTLLDNGLSPLYAACLKGFVEVVEILLEYGANPAIRVDLHMERGGCGETPLQAAIIGGHTKVAHILRQRLQKMPI